MSSTSGAKRDLPLILVIEDEPIVSAGTQFLLKRAGLSNVGIATTVKDAITKLDEGGTAIAIVDYRLGDETAEPVVDRLAELKLPYIALSGNPEDFRKSVTYAPTALIEKPYSPKLLLQAIHKSLVSQK